MRERVKQPPGQRGKSFRLTIRSTPKNIRKVEGFLQKVNTYAHLDEVHFHKLLVAATEAVNNGIFHANKSNPNKKVSIVCNVTDVMLECCVSDEGRGFNPVNIPSPLDEKNLLNEHGRGIFLMRTLMDTVEFVKHKGGSEVIMTMHFYAPTRFPEY
jgi:serine/threonine-protein kinase RsbW